MYKNILKLNQLVVKTRCLSVLYHKSVQLHHPRGLPRSIETQAPPPPAATSLEVIKKSESSVLTSTIPTDAQLKFEIDSVLKESGSLDEKKINALIKNFRNVFQFYYLLEHHSKKLSVENSIVFMSYFTKINQGTGIAITPQIQKMLDKLFLKHGPHYSAANCYYFLRDLNRLKQNLENQTVQVVIQLLKYHVNSLPLERLISIKTHLNDFKERSDASKQNEFITSLVKNLETAVVFAVQLKESDLDKLPSASYATDTLYHFTNDLSQLQYERLLSYVASTWKYLKANDILNVLESLSRRDFKHIELLTRVCAFVSNRVELFDVNNSSYEKNDLFLQEFYAFRILGALNKLGFYDKFAYGLLIEKILATIGDAKYLELGLEKKVSHIKIINGLLDTCIKANVHRSDALVEYFYNKYVNSTPSTVCVDDEHLEHLNFLYYSALCKYNKLTKKQIEDCVEVIKTRDLNNENLIKLMKSLVIYDCYDLANTFKSRIDTQNYINYMDKQFLRDLFSLDTITPTDVMNKPNIRRKALIENALETLFTNHEVYQVELLDNYSSFAVVSNKRTRQKLHLMVQYPLNRFKNCGELNGEFMCRYDMLKKSISISDFIWIVDMSELLGVQTKDLCEYLSKKVDQIYTQQLSNDVLNKIK